MASLLGVMAIHAIAQDGYPNRPVKIIAPQAPGGGVDLVARIIADRLRLAMGQSFIVDNQAGAGGAIAAQMTARAHPDGYTLMIGYVATHGTNPAVKKSGYDPVKDFTPIAMLGGTPNLLVVARAVPVDTLQEFVAYAKANPTKVDYGTSGVGTLNHLVMEQFKRASGVPSLAVPYRSIGQAFTEAIGGQIQVIFPGLAAALPHVRSGAFKPLAVTGNKRHPLLPNVPTFKESGYDGFDGLTWYGIVGPARMPAAITAQAQRGDKQDPGHAGPARHVHRAGAGRDADDARAIRQVHCRRGRALDGGGAGQQDRGQLKGETLALPQISVSQRLAAAFAAMPHALPADVTRMCDAVLMDVTGLCVAARHADYVQAALRATGEPGACTLMGHAGGFNVATAALCNGTAAHGEDYDDTFEGGPVHAGAVIIPALLATAEQHSLAGSDLGRGIAVGCEVMCRLCLVAPKRVHKAGFHPTAVFGALGAAAGVASALSLSTTRWVDALGIAGSMASGIIEYLAEGAWTKRMHAGWAAQAGYRAARMAQEGFTGPRTLFDGEHGFFHAFANSDGCDFTAMLEGAGERWLSADIAFKPYACGTMAHPYIDCARRLVAEGVRPDEVAAIECKTAEGIVHRLWEPLAAKQNPPNGYAAKFSVPYAIAVGMVRGDAGLGEYEEAVVRDPAVRTLAAKIRYVIDPDNPYPRQFTGHMRVTLANGEVREATQDHFRGGREEPLSAEALEAKFVANVRYGGWTADRAALALATLRGLRAVPRVRLELLRG